MGWFSQDKNENTSTQVKSGVNHDTGKSQTEFIVAQRDGSGHDHIAVSDTGQVTSHTHRSEK
jgi:hypothetical protein